MNTGKLNWDVLKKLLKENQGAVRQEVEKGGSVGEDCAVVSLKEGRLILSTDPVTAASENIGHIAYHININDIATTGATPLGIMVTILAPPSAELSDIETVMREISEEAKKHQVTILGGHTEVTDAVNRMVVSVTALGTMKPSDRVVWTGGAEPGDAIFVTKVLGLEGTSILVSDFKEQAMDILTEEELEEAERLRDRGDNAVCELEETSSSSNSSNSSFFSSFSSPSSGRDEWLRGCFSERIRLFCRADFCC